MLVLMLLRALAGCRLEAELFVPDVSARVADIGAYAQPPCRQHQCQNCQWQRGFRPFPFCADEISAIAAKA